MNSFTYWNANHAKHIANLEAAYAQMRNNRDKWKEGYLRNADALKQSLRRQDEQRLELQQLRTEREADRKELAVACEDRDALQVKLAAYEAVIECEEREKYLARVEVTARELCDRLHYVHGSSEYKAVWELAHIHYGPYVGPTYLEELQAATESLKEETCKGGTQ